MHGRKLAAPFALLGLGTACSSLAHQAGFQTEALALAPGGPAEVGASVAAYDAGRDWSGNPDIAGDPLLGTRATGFVRVGLPAGVSLRLGAGYAGVTALRPHEAGTRDTVSGFAGAASVFHALRPARPEARWQGALVWGGGVLLPWLPPDKGDGVGVVPGIHLGVIGSVAVTPRLHWHAGALGSLAFEGVGTKEVGAHGEGLLVTGPVWHLPIGRDANASRELQLMIEAGFGWNDSDSTVFPAGQLTLATGPRRRLEPQHARPVAADPPPALPPPDDTDVDEDLLHAPPDDSDAPLDLDP